MMDDGHTDTHTFFPLQIRVKTSPSETKKRKRDPNLEERNEKMRRGGGG
jgi:hypothetical protein